MTHARDESAKAFGELLEFIRTSRGFDFTGYKHASLGRRIRKRMAEVGVATYDVYRDHLELHAEEFGPLFDTVLINVTGFFRDAETWDVLRTQVVPDIVQKQGAPGEIRVWCAGCSTGEEAYSVVMTFAEALGRETVTERLKVYATDVDEDALSQARQGVYGEKSLETVPEELRERYFDAVGTGYTLHPDLRRRVIFGRHDLTRDAPISRLDLLTCRNALMYFNAETQAQIVGRFHFALNEQAYLVLGKAEMLLASNNDRFVPYSVPLRIFTRRRGGILAPPVPAALDMEQFGGSRGVRDRLLRDRALDAAPSAHLVVDVDGQVVAANTMAKTFFALTSRDEGRALKDLEVSYRPVELRSLIDQATLERRTVRRNAVERRYPGGDIQYFDVQVLPLVDDAGVVLGASVTFHDCTGYVRLQEEIKHSRQELETAYEELQSTNEELETTNEELQSSVEELETTNEELQSTNEELETTNEELQSTNEELETMNQELRVRTAELEAANRFHDGVLQNLPLGSIVLDPQFRVRAWNLAAQEMWGLRADEVVGSSFFSLDLGLPTGRLRGPIADCLAQDAPRTVGLDATNRRGQLVRCEVTCATVEPPGGVVLLIDAIRVDVPEGPAEAPAKAPPEAPAKAPPEGSPETHGS